jgi:hypothetical protein
VRRFVPLLGILLLVTVAGCKEREISKPAPAPVRPSSKAKPPESEPELGRACNTDQDCKEVAPQCLGFGEDDYVARPYDAVVMHCSRACGSVECPIGYACRRAPEITSIGSSGKIDGKVSLWCGKVATVTATPLAEIPRHVVFRYFARKSVGLPVVSMHWEGGNVVVVGPGFAQSFTKAQAKGARDAFKASGADIRKWKELWPESVPRGPNAPDALAAGHRKTLYRVAPPAAFSEASTPERMNREGAVLVWSPRGNGMKLYAATEADRREQDFDQIEDGLDAFFKVAPPAR